MKKKENKCKTIKKQIQKTKTRFSKNEKKRKQMQDYKKINTKNKNKVLKK
jgi:hypothetical protein